jgi:putative transposase
VPSQEAPQHLCLDLGYKGKPCEETALAHGYILHRPAGKPLEEAPEMTLLEEAPSVPPVPEKRARRWVVEVAHSWINRFRRLLVRWEKKTQNYLSMLYFACAIICWRKAGV